MFDPLTYALKAQQAAVMGAFCLGRTALAAFSHLVKGEAALVHATAHRRAVEQHAPVMAAPLGAKWTDHYGRRSHDVDIEHMR